MTFFFLFVAELDCFSSSCFIFPTCWIVSCQGFTSLCCLKEERGKKKRKKKKHSIPNHVASLSRAGTENRFNLENQKISGFPIMCHLVYFLYQSCVFFYDSCRTAWPQWPMLPSFQFQRIIKMVIIVYIYILTVKPLLDLTGIYFWWLWFFLMLMIWLPVLFFFLQSMFWGLQNV